MLAPDGSPVPVFAALPAGAAPLLVHGCVEGSILDLGCGAGRLSAALADLGHPVVGVDICVSMLERVDPRVTTVCADIDGLDLGQTFGGVVLASYLINSPSAPAFLATCRRHVSSDGVVIVQRYEPEWARSGFDDAVTAGDVTVSVHSFSGVSSSFSAVVTYTLQDESWDQAIDARILDDDDVSALAVAAGLTVDRWLDEYRTWGVLVPS